jgi:hypothetical protein
MGLRECYVSVTRVLQECYKSVTRVLQECYKSVARVLSRLLLKVLQDLGRPGNLLDAPAAPHALTTAAVTSALKDVFLLSSTFKSAPLAL